MDEMKDIRSNKGYDLPLSEFLIFPSYPIVLPPRPMVK